MPADNLHKDTLFIVDEASMIANEGLDSFVFGSGRLLDDLIQYVYSGENCRLILIGESRLESRDITGLQPTGLGDSVNSSRTPKRGLGNPVQRNPATRRTTKPHGRDLSEITIKRLLRFHESQWR